MTVAAFLAAEKKRKFTCHIALMYTVNPCVLQTGFRYFGAVDGFPIKSNCSVFGVFCEKQV